MRLSTSLCCAFLAVSAAFVACGGEPAEEGGTAVRPDDEGDAGTGGSTSKGGSAGKGGTSAKGGSAGKGGSGGSSGSGGTGDASGAGGGGGSTIGVAGSAGAASGGASGAGGAGGKAGAGAGGSAGEAAAGNAGASGNAAGSAGSDAGGGGSSGGAGGLGGNAGASAAGAGGSSAGAAGSGGAVPCTDGYTTNFSFGKAFAIGDIGDNSDASKVSGKVPGEQIDWFKYNGLDNASPFAKVNPNVSWPANQGVKVCMYFKCTSGMDWGSACDSGSPATFQGMNGCCDTGGKIDAGDFSCCSGFGCDDAATVWVSVEPTSASNACASYDLEVNYGTGLTGAPQPGDGNSPSPQP